MHRTGGFWKSCVKYVKPDVIPFGPVVNWCVCMHIGTLEEMIIQTCLFFLSSWGKMMTRMILWSAFSIGGDWVVNHIVTLWCVTLPCSLRWVLTFWLPLEKLHYAINFCGIHSVWRGLGSWTRSKQNDEVIPHTVTGQFSLHETAIGLWDTKESVYVWVRQWVSR